MACYASDSNIYLCIASCPHVRKLNLDGSHALRRVTDYETTKFNSFPMPFVVPFPGLCATPLRWLAMPFPAGLAWCSARPVAFVRILRIRAW